MSISKSDTLPFQYQATLYFGYAPKTDVALQAYIDEFLLRYYQACGLMVDAQQHAQNVACFVGLSTLKEVEASIPLIDPELVVDTFPPAQRPAAREFQANFCTLLRSVYPLVNGEQILNDFVTILQRDFLNCAAGCVVYMRQTNLLRIDFILPAVPFDPSTGQASLPAPASRASTTPNIRTEMAVASAASPSQWISLSGQVASTLAFALPGSNGIMLSAAITGISGLFSMLFGGGNSTGPALATLIDQAVQELKDYMQAAQLDSVKNDVIGYFNWCKGQITSDTGWTDQDVDSVKATLLPEYLNFTTAGHFSLPNDFQQFAVEQYTQTNTYVPREQDLALTVVSMIISALLSAYKITIQLQAQVAYSNQWDAGTGSCKNLQADKDFQDYTNDWMRTVSVLIDFINGTPPTPADPKEVATQKYTLDYIAKALTRCYPYNNTGDPDIQYITQNFGDPNTPPWSSMVDYAQTYGCAAALERLILHKQVARLLKISPITYVDQRRCVCVGYPFPACYVEGADGWSFADNFDPNSSYQNFNYGPGSATPAQQNDVIQHWNDHFNAVLQQLTAPSTTAVSFADDLNNAKLWRDAASSSLAQLPPASPANTIVVPDDKWGGPADATSQWATAVYVLYAVSFVNAQGPSQRCDWSAKFDVNHQNKPLLRHIPVDSANSISSRQIWRQFIFRDPVSGDADYPGLPKIVGVLGDNTTTEWTDDDPAAGKDPIV